MVETDYKIVNFVDVNELLTFAKKEFKALDHQIKEEERVEGELRKFIEYIEKHSGHKVHHIGKERRGGNLLMKFLFRDGGYLEVIHDKPLTINAHFPDQKSAEMFAKGLREALHIALPEHPVKDMVIGSVKVEDGKLSEELTFDKWNTMHHIAIHKTAVITVVALFIFLVIELTKEIFKVTTDKLLHYHSLVISVFTAVILAFFFDRIKGKVEDFVGKVLKI